MNFNRRNFIRNAAAGVAGVAAIPTILAATMPEAKVKLKKDNYPFIKKGDVILFQGDSITDAGREKEKELPNVHSSFGPGYAFLIASQLLNEQPDKELTIYNRGISGHKVFQLADRWQKDCLDLNPTVVSILIGVNDFWHKLKHNYDGTLEKYETDYRNLLRLTQRMLPNVRLVIGEPFAMAGCPAVDASWFPEFDSYRAAARKVATEAGAIFIPYQSILNEAAKYAPAKYWTADGVHPSMAGCALMAAAWLNAIKK